MWGLLPSPGTEATLTEERGITPRVFEQLFERIRQVCLHLNLCLGPSIAPRHWSLWNDYFILLTL